MTESKKKISFQLKRSATIPIPCLLLDKNNRPLKYDFENKTVSYAGPREFTEFTNKRAALHAQWHAIENDKKAGKFEPWKDYKVEEM